MNIEMMTKVIIPLIGIVLAYVIVPLINKRFSREQLDYIYSWVRIAVHAAEQMDKANLITIPKKEFVLDYINNKGFKITTEDLDTLIEAAVKELKIEIGEL